jgi:hypothetical protein
MLGIMKTCSPTFGLDVDGNKNKAYAVVVADVQDIQVAHNGITLNVD